VKSVRSQAIPEIRVRCPDSLGIRAIGAVLIGLLTGCHTLGPSTIKGTHSLYNQAIVSSIDEQFLENLVRLRYRDTPYFVDVTNVTASVNLEAALGLNGTQIGLDNATSNFLDFSAGVGYSTTPTISYQPVEGEGFVKKFLTPISLESLLLLTQSGWSLGRVYGLCVEQINGLQNASNASGPTPKAPPVRYREFNRLLQLLDELRGKEAILSAVDPGNGTVQVELRPTDETQRAVNELKALLGLDPQREHFYLSMDFVNQRPDTIAIRTRSPLSLLFYLSHNVDVPLAHRQSGLVTVTRNPDGSAFDWHQTPAGSRFNIRYRASRPENAFAAIPYRGQWFYLEDTDLESKSSFMLMAQVFRLQAGTVSVTAPMLTIPVRR